MSVIVSVGSKELDEPEVGGNSLKTAALAVLALSGGTNAGFLVNVAKKAETFAQSNLQAVTQVLQKDYCKETICAINYPAQSLTYEDALKGWAAPEVKACKSAWEHNYALDCKSVLTANQRLNIVLFKRDIKTTLQRMPVSSLASLMNELVSDFKSIPDFMMEEFEREIASIMNVKYTGFGSGPPKDMPEITAEHIKKFYNGNSRIIKMIKTRVSQHPDIQYNLEEIARKVLTFHDSIGIKGMSKITDFRVSNQIEISAILIMQEASEIVVETMKDIGNGVSTIFWVIVFIWIAKKLFS